MPKQNEIRYKYHFEFFDASGKCYSRTRRFDHKITDEEEAQLTHYYSYLLELRYNTTIYSFHNKQRALNEKAQSSSINIFNFLVWVLPILQTLHHLLLRLHLLFGLYSLFLIITQRRILLLTKALNNQELLQTEQVI